MRDRPLRIVALGVGGALVALVVVLALNVVADPTVDPPRFAGKPAPDFTLPTLEGTDVSSSALRGDGRAVLVNFWNSWCIPCRQEHPALVAFWERHRDDPDFAMVGIVREDVESEIRSYVDREGVGWVVAFDPGAKAALDYGTTGQPETFMIASDGRVVAEQIGPASLDDLELMLRVARGAA
jgi:cytochrome c biogenesis protein CcmG/thiol:disulfide interchange protein DsbE